MVIIAMFAVTLLQRATDGTSYGAAQRHNSAQHYNAESARQKCKLQ